MTIERIRTALTRQPFVPFDVRLVDGRSFTIEHTDYLAVPPIKRPRDVIVFTPKPDDPDEYRSHHIDIALIVELTIPTTSATASSQTDGG
jgi:hypothetical protein